MSWLASQWARKVPAKVSPATGHVGGVHLRGLGRSEGLAVGEEPGGAGAVGDGDERQGVRLQCLGQEAVLGGVGEDDGCAVQPGGGGSDHVGGAGQEEVHAKSGALVSEFDEERLGLEGAAQADVEEVMRRWR